MKMPGKEAQPIKQRKSAPKHNSKWKAIESNSHENERIT